MKTILSIANTTIGEAVRRKVLLVILLIAVLFLAIAPGLSILSARQERTVLIGMTLGIIQLASALIAIVLTVYLIPNEIERRTIYTILSKPVERYQFLIGKYLGAVGALGIMIALMTAVLIAVFFVTFRVRDQVVGIDQLAMLARAPLMFFVQMSILAAVVVFFSTFVTPLVNFFLSGGVYLVGSMFNPFFETISQDQGVAPIAKTIATILNTILPNFANYNVQNPIINPGQQIANETAYYLVSTGYGIVYISALLLLAILVFQYREV
jgi:ABC-type transport system involved in multi-copper enzyme maturation permease subunit